MRSLMLLPLLLSLFAPLASAQPSLDQLWPREDGKSWTYDGTYEEMELPTENFTGRLIFAGEGTMAPGVTVQNLIGQVDEQPVARHAAAPAGLSPLRMRLWMARPELRSVLADHAKTFKAIFWPATLLAPSELFQGVGHRQTPDRIGSWRDEIGNWSWWYLTDDLSPGAMFTLQLLPDLVSDVFLHGTVRGTAESVSTGAGSWTNAVIVDYVVDLGTGSITDEGGNVIGTVDSELRGWVAFVPAVGPVASDETYTLVAVDCPDGCPEEDMIGEPLTRTQLSLRSTPVARQGRSWSDLKSAW